ncbi:MULTISPECIES: Ig-like domain-containing protein [Clostridium]|uniref:RCC1 domain-containing protein n=1 Tax=Clostridium TaxID=1485 RepID=UPI0008267693|nr:MULTISPECIES: Ig-like domain-containing protein [Clostridium]
MNRIKQVFMNVLIAAIGLGIGVTAPNLSINKDGHVSLKDNLKVYAAENTINNMSAGGGSFVVKADGSLWGCGRNDYGQLGDGTKIDKASWEQLGSGFIKVSSSRYDTIALKADGTLWACGANHWGELGDGTTDCKTSWEQVGTGFSDVDSKGNHSLALKADGTLWACGFNSDGELGDGSKTYKTSWEQVGSGFSKISCGEAHSLALKTDGTLWACGFNNYGELGDGSTINETSWEQVGSGFTKIVAGYYSSLGIKTDGSLWGCGFNGDGELGDGKSNGESSNRISWEQIGSGFSEISIGDTHSLAVKTDGTLWSCGTNHYGELGDGSTDGKSIWTQVGIGFSKVACGNDHSLALKADGTLWACGCNYNGQLGDGSKKYKLSWEQTLTGSGAPVDTTGPSKPTITVDKEMLTIADGSDFESGVKETDYQINGGDWIKYAHPVTLEEGTYTINAKTIDNAGNSSDIATEKVTVGPIPTGINLNVSTYSLTVGQTFNLIPTITPENVTDKSVEWFSSDSSVVSVDANGKITALKAGTAIITVSLQDGNLSNSCQITVSDKAPTSTITLNKLVDSLAVGGSDTLTAETTPKDAASQGIKWSSSDSSVASVDANGKVTALKAGTAVITAVLQDGSNASASCTVNVESVEVKTVMLTINMTNNTSKQFKISEDVFNDFLSWYDARSNNETKKSYYTFTIPATESSPEKRSFIPFTAIEDFDAE